MPTNQDANFELIENNYLQAAQNYYNDMAATRSPKEVLKVEQNYSEAEAAWAQALIEVLNRSDATVKQVQQGLKTANAAVAAARANHEAIGSLIGKLQMASSLAGTLVRIAAI